MLIHRIALIASFVFFGAVQTSNTFAEEGRGDLASKLATATRTNILAPAEKAKLEAETAKLIAEAQAKLAEADMSVAKTQQIYLEIERLRQRMRITDYEFDRVTRADYEMNRDIAKVNENLNLVRPLFLGRSNWKTWIGLEMLMQSTGDAAVILQVMFEIPAPEFAPTEFVPNFGGLPSTGFPGGNLGLLYSYARDNDLSFKSYGAAHQAMMRVVAMITTAAEAGTLELRDINQAIRFTIAKID